MIVQSSIATLSVDTILYPRARYTFDEVSERILYWQIVTRHRPIGLKPDPVGQRRTRRDAGSSASVAGTH